MYDLHRLYCMTLCCLVPILYWSFDTEDNFTLMEGDQQSQSSALVSGKVNMCICCKKGSAVFIVKEQFVKSNKEQLATCEQECYKGITV